MEASRVRQIFDLYLSLGAMLPTVEELARRDWSNKAWRTKKGDAKGGSPFDKGSLYALLTNPLYVGKVKHKSELYAGEHEPIVANETFQKVQATLQHNSRTGGVQVRNRFGARLKGLLFCKGCGRTMVHTFTGKGDKKRYRYYTCTQAIKCGRKSCPSGSLPADEIERVVVDQIRCIAGDRKLQREVLRQARAQCEAQLGELTLERRRLERELALHHAELRKLAVKSASGGAVTARLTDLHDQVARAECRLSQLGVEVSALELEQICQRDVEAAFADFDSVWVALSPREQAKVLSLLVARVEYDATDSTVAVSFHPSAIKALAARQLGEAA